MPSIWQARVDCWYRAGNDSRNCVIRHFLLEADGSHDAFDKASKFAEENAGGAEKWLGFEVKSVSRVRFPLSLKAAL